MISADSTLICVAVREEVGQLIRASGAEILITGMGRRNAEACLRRRLASQPPALVLTCGFAGGLNPALPAGTVVFSEDEGAGLAKSLGALGALPVRFYCGEHVVSTAAQKLQLQQTTGADAVEMESEVIRTLCQQHHITSATVRVISDAAQQDLPLDFNALLTARHQIHFGKLAWALLRSPKTIPRLLEFQKQTTLARDALDQVLARLLSP